MNYMLPLWMLRADEASEKTIQENGRLWAELIDDPRRSDAREFLRSLPDGPDYLQEDAHELVIPLLPGLMRQEREFRSILRPHREIRFFAGSRLQLRRLDVRIHDVC